MNELAYYLERVEVSDNDCMTWTAYRMPGGYGMTSQGSYPHRDMYEIFVGPIPRGLEIDHLCRNRACINPEHLEAVTHLENVRRGSPAQQTHCVNGHEFTPENLLPRKDGRRGCRACRDERDFWRNHARP